MKKRTGKEQQNLVAGLSKAELIEMIGRGELARVELAERGYDKSQLIPRLHTQDDLSGSNLTVRQQSTAISVQYAHAANQEVKKATIQYQRWLDSFDRIIKLENTLVWDMIRIDVLAAVLVTYKLESILIEVLLPYQERMNDNLKAFQDGYKKEKLDILTNQRAHQVEQRNRAIADGNIDILLALALDSDDLMPTTAEAIRRKRKEQDAAEQDAKKEAAEQAAQQALIAALTPAQRRDGLLKGKISKMMTKTKESQLPAARTLQESLEADDRYNALSKEQQAILSHLQTLLDGANPGAMIAKIMNDNILVVPWEMAQSDDKQP